MDELAKEIPVYSASDDPITLGSHILEDGVYRFYPSGVDLTLIDLGNIMDSLHILNIGNDHD